MILSLEPTSALDPQTADLVEKSLLSNPCIKIWVTHNPAQEQRVATESLHLNGVDSVEEVNINMNG